ncbi:MAG: hypothetical protein ACR2LK_16815 [Solirubrobacteraceae bacterium]
MAAAFTPVVLALIREALAKSTDAVVRAVPPVRGGVRQTGMHDTQTGASSPVVDYSQAADPVVAPAPPLVADPGEPIAQQGEIRYHGLRRRGGHHWRLAVVTGVLGFLVCAVVLTVPELIAGKSAFGGRDGTTLLGGNRDRDDTTVTNTTTSRTTTIQTRTVVVPPTRTVTVPASPRRTTTPGRPRAEPQRTTTTPARPTESSSSPRDGDEPSSGSSPPTTQPTR